LRKTWPPEYNNGSGTHFLEVVTFDWDEDSVNFKVFDPKLGRYAKDAPSGWDIQSVAVLLEGSRPARPWSRPSGVAQRFKPWRG
jgi:hypothetical protein